MTSSPDWSRVDQYLTEALRLSDPALESALARSGGAGLPAIQVSAVQGRFLHLLARTVRARKILEIGTLGGFSTIWLARALPRDGYLVTLEINPTHAAIAKTNLQRAGLADHTEIRVGPASESLEHLVQEGAGPFDLVFIDADKPSTVLYYEWALRLSRPGSLIVVDNVVREGTVADAESTDPNVVGMREFVARIAHDPRVIPSVLQTVGEKKHDGFAFVLVLEPDRPVDEAVA